MARDHFPISEQATLLIRSSAHHRNMVLPRTYLISFSADQDVQENDILFVHEGTYLIGTAAMVTSVDGPMLYQHHLAKFRVNDTSPVSPYYFLALLQSDIFQLQVRSKQFSADIIDSVVGRIEEIFVPIPRSKERHDSISTQVREAVEGRAKLRVTLSQFFHRLEEALQKADTSDDVISNLSSIQYSSTDEDQTFLGQREKFSAYKRKTSALIDDILIPKYYNPALMSEMSCFSGCCDLRSIRDLVEEGVIRLSVGDEIGRLSYGTGNIPFVRTSDLGTYELKSDAKHGVDDAIWSEYAEAQGLQPGDILLVRDGTYLVGSTCMIFSDDLPMLFCGGIYRVHVLQPSRLLPALLYALLNMPQIKRQIRSKQFTRDVIDTLGQRIQEVILPIPRASELREFVSEFVGGKCSERVRLRQELSVLFQTLHQ